MIDLSHRHIELLHEIRMTKLQLSLHNNSRHCSIRAQNMKVVLLTRRSPLTKCLHVMHLSTWLAVTPIGAVPASVTIKIDCGIILAAEIPTRVHCAGTINYRGIIHCISGSGNVHSLELYHSNNLLWGPWSSLSQSSLCAHSTATLGALYAWYRVLYTTL